MSFARISKYLLFVLLIFVASGTSSGQSTSPPAGTSIQPKPEQIPIALSLRDLEQIALERSPTLVQANAQVRISQGQAVQAGLYPNPQIGYVADKIGVNGTAGELQGMFIEQEIVTGHKLQLSRAKFMQEAREAELQAMAQRYRVLHSVRVAYYNVLTQKRRRALREQLNQNAADAAKTVTELINTGQANRSDLLQSQIELQRAKASLEMADRQYHGAWEELAAVVGMPEMQETQLQDELDFRKESLLDRDTALSNLLTCSPELLAAQAEVARDRLGLQRECVEPIPNVNIRAETGYDFDSRDAVAGMEVGFRLPVFDKNQGTIIQAQAELMRAQAEVNRIELILRRKFARTIAEYESAMTFSKTYQNEILPKAADAYKSYAESFQQRRAAWPQVLDAQRQYFQLNEDYLENLLTARRAEAQLVTFFLDDGLSEPPTPSPEGHRDSTPKPR